MTRKNLAREEQGSPVGRVIHLSTSSRYRREPKTTSRLVRMSVVLLVGDGMLDVIMQHCAYRLSDHQFAASSTIRRSEYLSYRFIAIPYNSLMNSSNFLSLG